VAGSLAQVSWGGESKRQAWLLAAFVAFDALLKVLALHALPLGEPVRACALCFALRINPQNLSSVAQGVVAGHGALLLETGGEFDALLAAALVAMALGGVLTRRRVVLAVIGTLTAAACLAAIFPLRGISPAAAVALRAAQTMLCLVIWALATSVFWKAGAFLWTVTGISNLLSSYYPPFGIVDYFWSSPLNRLIGMGIFNFADVLWLLAFPVFAIALAGSIGRLLLGFRPRADTGAA
jgi:hypothetical protein